MRSLPDGPLRPRFDRAAETEAETQAEADAAGAATAAALDVARTAIRLGARRVRCVTLESRVEMPASEFEIEEAEVEGIELLHRLGPKRIVGTDHVEGLETHRRRVRLRRRRPIQPLLRRRHGGHDRVRLGDPRDRADGGSLLAGTRRRRRDEPARHRHRGHGDDGDDRRGRLCGRRSGLRATQPDRCDRRRPPRRRLDPPAAERGGAAPALARPAAVCCRSSR